MKLIIILIAINIAFGGRCPPKEVLSSCTCDQDTEMIICQETLNRVSKVFNWMSKNLDFNEMHFKRVKLYPSFIEEEYERIIQDDTFGDITFEEFQAHNVSKIGSNAFNITAHKIKKFECFDCSLVNQPPKYNLFKVINLMINLNHLSLRLNVTEIPANAIQPFNGQHSNISFLVISSIQSLTIKSGAFHNFIGLEFFSIWDSTIKLIEKDAFKLQALDIEFQECNLKGESLQSGTFNGIKPLKSHSNFVITLENTTIDYLAEAVFKPALDNDDTIYIRDFAFTDCNDCRNYWLVREDRKSEFTNGLFLKCKGGKISANASSLFDDEIQTKLTQRCK